MLVLLSLFFIFMELFKQS